MRVAIYYTPAKNNPLARAAAQWLGRSAFSADDVAKPDPAIARWVTEPQRYGFHATLRAPFHLADGVSLGDVEQMVMSLAARTENVALGQLQLGSLNGFLALTAPQVGAELVALEAQVRERCEPFRAPLNADEIARRKPERLSASQRRNLDDWGYPNVGTDFRFHMTLTNSLGPDAPTGELARRADAVFAQHLSRTHFLDALAIFVEDAPGAPFRILELYPLQRPINMAAYL
ncbi:DUF1045 domain-containing protein [Pelagibacterium sp.]|uniref:DUF1045 domain-containing protein n=1 Tax=Pelagibacterium sp. TaxID=1967288 RepID=UPI003A914C04